MDTTLKTAYAEAVRVVEESLTEAAAAQWAGDRPDLRLRRRELIELRRQVPNDREDASAQLVRRLMNVYLSVIDEQAATDVYAKTLVVGEEVALELERLRPRAARLGLAALDPATRSFKVGGGRASHSESAAPAGRPASQQRSGRPPRGGRAAKRG